MPSRTWYHSSYQIWVIYPHYNPVRAGGLCLYSCDFNRHDEKGFSKRIWYHSSFHNSGAEICWYFPKTREQFRLRGQLILVGEDYPELTLKKERQTTWQGLSDAARVQFAWSNPGEPRIESDPAFSQPPPDPEQPLPNFCLLLLEPIQVDHLELRGDPQNRWRYTQECDRQWITQAINP